MTTLNISLPDTLKDFVEQQVEQGGFSSSSEYLRTLIREDQKRVTQGALEKQLLEGLAEGKVSEMKVQDWQKLRQSLLKKQSKGAR